MKARNKKTGEISELASYAKITLESCDSYGCQREWNPEDVELIQDKTDDFDWQSFRAEAAKDILCAMISNEGVADERNVDDFTKDNQVKDAVLYADKLISKLKEKEEK